MDIITGKALSRRTVLRGAGAALFLPLLDAMSPTRFLLHGQSHTKPAHRFQAIYVPNGMAMEYWDVKGVGRDYEISPILAPLAPFRDQMLVLSGLNATWVQVHNGASGAFLTGATHGGRNYTEFLSDTSMDQILAREIGHETEIPSLELSTDPLPNAGACSVGLSCIYVSTISWRSPTQPLTPEYNPRAVFERLFGDSGSTERSAMERRMRQQKSLLDSVVDRLAGLKRELGPHDLIRLEQYTEGIRDVEQRIEQFERQEGGELASFDQPQGVPDGYEEHLELMLDLQILALQADLTRVLTFMFAREISARTYPQVGVPESHHPLSHHNDRPELIAHMAKINMYHAQLFANYVAKLRATPDGDGTLLDNMTILYGSGLSNSTRHSGISLPLLLLGGGAGTLPSGRHIAYSGEPMPNLLLTLMDNMGVPLERLGAGSTGRVPLNPLTL
jgi:hypothetical protein